MLFKLNIKCVEMDYLFMMIQADDMSTHFAQEKKKQYIYIYFVNGFIMIYDGSL